MSVVAGILTLTFSAPALGVRSTLEVVPVAPESLALWTAQIELPTGSTASKTQRSSDQGYGVDLVFGAGDVKASVWDDDGAAFFEVRLGGAACKIDVGSNGLGPGLTVEVFAQKGMRCSLTATKTGPTAYKVALSAEAANDGSADCDQEDETGTKEPCGPVWRSTEAESAIPKKDEDAEPEPSALWTADVELPEGALASRAQRGGDQGYGVDLAFGAGRVKASVLDDDGAAFFEVRLGGAACKIDVGSNGLGPGLTVEVFAQKGMRCTLTGVKTGDTAYKVSLSAEAANDGSADCDQEDETGTKKPCGPTWRSQEAEAAIPKKE